MYPVKSLEQFQKVISMRRSEGHRTRTVSRDFLCAIQRADNPRQVFSKGQMVNSVREVKCWDARQTVTK